MRRLITFICIALFFMGALYASPIDFFKLKESEITTDVINQIKANNERVDRSDPSWNFPAPIIPVQLPLAGDNPCKEDTVWRKNFRPNISYTGTDSLFLYYSTPTQHFDITYNPSNKLELLFTPKPTNWYGSETLIIGVAVENKDSNRVLATAIVTITVAPVDDEIMVTCPTNDPNFYQTTDPDTVYVIKMQEDQVMTIDFTDYNGVRLIQTVDDLNNPENFQFFITQMLPPPYMINFYQTPLYSGKTVTFTPIPDYYGKYRFAITNLDNLEANHFFSTNQEFNTCRRTFEIWVTNINDAPVINSYLPTSLNLELIQGASQNFSVNATDADDPYSPTGPTLIYTWTVVGSNYGTPINQQISTTPTANYTFDYPGTFTVTLVVSDGIVTLDPVVWTVEVVPNGPIFSLLGGVYTQGVEVSLSTPAAYPNAPIYYTLDGSIPDANSPVFDPAFPIVIDAMNDDNVVTVTAMFIDTVYGPSAVLSQTYHITGDIGNLVFNLAPYDSGLNSFIYTAEQDLTITSSTVGAQIYYTTSTIDGTPPLDPLTNGILYNAPIHIGEDTKLQIRAIATKNLWNDSAYAQSTFRVTGRTRIDNYSFVPPPGNYIVPVDSVFMVTVTGIQLYPNDVNTVLRYAINGTPTANSPIYTGQAIALSEPSFIRIMAFRQDWAPSVYAEGVYIINNRVIIAKYPSTNSAFSPAPGITYTSPINVSINSTIPTNGRVYFTISFIDGTEPADPDQTSTLYTSNSQIFIDRFQTAIIKARAYHDDVLPSPVYRAGYTVTGPVDNPVFDPPPGAYETSQLVSISTPLTTNTEIYYTYSNDPTIEPLDPTNTGTGDLYAGVINAPEGTTIIKARAYKNNWAASGISRGVYYVNILAPPSFVTDSGVIYTSPVNVEIVTDAANQICYTTDGSDPTAIGLNITNGFLYNGPINVPFQTVRTIKARAIRNGWNQSAIAQRTYTVTDQVVTPVFTINQPGTYLNPTEVGISCATPGVSIYYTTDGSAPSINSTLYTVPFFVNVTSTINAIAVKTDWATSNILSGVYNISGTVAMPAFTPPPGTYTNAINVFIYSATPGAIIRYTTDGTEPSEVNGTIFNVNNLVPVNSTLTLKAIAYVAGGNSSTVLTGVYNITGVVEAPVFSLASGAYAGSQLVTISSTTDGATIHYTIGGTTPDANSTVYTTAINVNQSMTIKAIAILNGWVNSGIGVATYIINNNPISMVFSPLPGSHYEDLALRIIAYPPDAVVHYTTDGSDPTMASLVYDNQNLPQITQTTTVKAIAYHNDWLTSAIKTGQYNFFVRTPSLSHAGGVYAQGFDLVLTPNTIGSAIYYTLDGSDPTVSPTRIQYSASIPVLQTTVLRAYGARNNWTDSPEIAATYTINGAVSVPVFSIQGGTYNAPITLGLSASPSDAIILYTTDGVTVPTSTTGTVYSGSFIVSENATITAIAYKPFWTTSQQATATYTFRPVAPVFTVIESLSDHKTISLSTSPVDQTYIRYTTDGVTTPSRTTGTLYVGPFPITQNTSIKAIAYRVATINWDVSLVSSSDYTLQVPAPIFSPAAGTFSQAQTVQFTNTGYDDIYYTTEGTDPNSGSVHYNGAFIVSTNTTIKAIAMKNNWVDSDITTATYTFQLPAPSFSSVTGTYPNAINLSMTTMAGAEIRYTTDESDPTITSTLYGSAIPINSYTIIKAKSFLAGWNESVVTTSTFSFQVGTPYFTPPSGAYTSEQHVQIESATAGAEIRYTTDGVTVPTVASTPYTAPITVPVQTSMLIKAKAFKTDWVTSEEGIGSYTVTGSVVVDGGVNGINAFTPAPGTYTDTQGVSISGSFNTNPGDVIRYTLDGTEPDENSPEFPGYLNLPAGIVTTIKIKVFRTGWAPSATITGIYNITGQVVISNNMFTPIAGSYPTAMVVTLDTNIYPSGATLRYTMDGTDPTTNSDEYISPLIAPAGAVTTIKVRGFKQDWIPSNIETAVYTISPQDPQVTFVDPIFSPPSGTMAPGSVTIGATLPANAIVYYTLDDSTPTETSAVYTNAAIPIPFGTPTIIRARAYAANYRPSNVEVAVYNATNENILPAPVFTPAAGTYTAVQNVVISEAIPGSDIRYTLDGTDPIATSTQYSAPIPLALNQMYSFKAKAFKTGSFASPITIANYNMTGVVTDVLFSIPGGTYAGAQSVALSTTTEDAIIRYTLDNSEPTATSTRYYAPIVVPANATTTIKAKAFRSGWVASNTITKVYNVNGQVTLGVAFSWAPGIYQTARNISVNATVLPADAIVRFTTNGDEPSVTSPIYSAPISLGLNTSTMIKVKAFKTDWIASETVSGFYQITGQVVMSTPMFTPASGTYQTQQFVTLNQTTTPAGATLRYTLDGSIPTSTSQAYSPSNPIAVLFNSAATINVIAFLDNWIASDMMSASYNVTGAVALADPLFSPIPGTYNTPQSITINGATPADAVIRYTLDGSNPTASSPIYSTALALPMAQVTTIKAQAFKNTWASSAIVSGVYNMTGQVAIIQPVFNPAPGYYATPQMISIVATTVPANAVIRYTTNGDNPTVTSPIYSAPISIAADTQVLIKARAFSTDWLDSEVYSGLYNVTGAVAPVVFNPLGGTYSIAQNVVLTSTTPYSSIYYSIDGTDPSQASTLYTNAINIPINTSRTVKARAYRAGWETSTITQQTYNITGQVALSMPVFSVASGTYQAAQTVSVLSVPTPSDAVIRYTVDGSEPTVTSTIYSAPIAIPLNTVRQIKVKAFRTNWLPSDTYTADYNVTGQIALSAAMFNPAPGVYQTSQTVILNTATIPAGATLRYTLDGTDPTESSAAYISSIVLPLNSNTLIKVRAFKADWTPSVIVSGQYNITGQVAFTQPVFTPAGGNYNTTQTVAISSPTPSDAIIRYTTDGTTPSETVGTIYSTPLTVSIGQTIKAIAYKTNWIASPIASATYQFNVSAPTFTPPSGSYPVAQTVTLNTTTAGASIRYTLDGSDPTNMVGIIYTAPFSVSNSAIVKAIAYQTGWNSSPVVSAVYSINGAVANPIFNPIAGTYNADQMVSITSFPGDASIRYTTNGDDPTPTTGTLYTAPVAITANTTLKAMAFKTDWINSQVVTATYNLQVSNPVLSLASGTYTTGQTVSITNSTPGAQIRYTTNGTDPTPTVGTLYTTPIVINSSQTIKAIAYKTGWVSSMIVTGSYEITGLIADVVFNPLGGTYQTAQNVILSTSTPGTTIRFTTNGSDPTEESQAYSSAILVPLNTIMTIKARAFKAGWVSSGITEQTYNITGQVEFPAVVFTPEPGVYTTAQIISIAMPNPQSAGVFYTLDGTEPTTASMLYVSPISLPLNSNITIKVKAFMGGWTPSYTYTGTYTTTGTVQMSAPYFSPAAGLYTTAQSVTINNITVPTGAVIHYTIDGSDPSLSSPVYSTPINVGINSSVVIRARAYLNDWLPSTIHTAAYTVTGQVAIPDPVFTPAAGLYNTAQFVTLNTATQPSGSQVRYTTDGSDPTETSQLYTSAIELLTNTQTTIKVRAFKTDWISSPIYTADYTITGQVTLTGDLFTPPAGIYTTAQTVTISAVPFPAIATVHYTLDGSEPTEASDVYTAPIDVPLNTDNLVIKAKAFSQNWIPSETITAIYKVTGQVNLAVNPFSVEPGLYTTAQTVAITPAILPTSAVIRYTLDGTDPTTQSPAYLTPLVFALDTTTTLKIKGFAENWIDSDIQTAVYTITGTVENPTLSHVDGIYSESFNLMVQTTTADAVIRYTLDGTDPDENSPIYTEEIPIPELIHNYTVKAKAYKTGWVSSEIVTGTYSVFLLPINVRAFTYSGYIRVIWNSPIVTRALDSFNVYRRKLGEAQFVKMNSAPIIATQDSLYHYDDYAIQNNQSYQYYVTAIYNGFESNPSMTTTIEYQSQDLTISDVSHVYPNPATTSCKIQLVLSRNDNVQISVSIYDFAGKKVQTLTVPTTNANLIEIPWNLKTSGGVSVARGTYFARIVANDGINRSEKVIKIAVK